MNEKTVLELIKKCEQDKIEKIVVGAFIENNGKILLLERPKDDFMGGIFELPSGNLEHGEELLEGLKREVKEETNLEVIEIVDYVDSFDYRSGSGKKARQLNFHILTDGEIILSEHTNFAWSNKKDLAFEKTTDSVKKAIQTFTHYTKEKKQ